MPMMMASKSSLDIGVVLVESYSGLLLECKALIKFWGFMRIFDLHGNWGDIAQLNLA